MMDRRDFLKKTFAAAALFSVANLAAKTGLAETGKTIGKLSRRKMKNSEDSLPLLGYGMMRLPVKDGRIDDASVQVLVDRAMASGLNYFDTAYPYHGGQSEISTGKALKKYPRKSFFLANKMPTWLIHSRKDAERIFDEQLRKCQVDYFDFYLIHSLSKARWEQAEKAGIYDFLLQKKKEGRIRYLGFSFHDNPEMLQKIVDAHKWDFAQIQLNYIDWDMYRSREQYEILTKAGIPVIIMEPLRGGFLANPPAAWADRMKKADPEASAASWSFRYIASLPNVLTILSGMTKLQHLEENLRTFSPVRELSVAERGVIADVVRMSRSSETIPCTGCRYCVPCPAGVDIPRVFALYNGFKTNRNYRAFSRVYSTMDEESIASACVNCGACLKKCPQHIKIPEEMAKIAKFVADHRKKR